MRTLLSSLTKNILLVIGGFLACLTGNFFFGMLIGAAAGVLHCCFGGALSRKGVKGALIASLPVAIVVAILSGVGAAMSGGLKSVGGIIITIVVTLLCGFVGSYIDGSKFYKEQTQEAPQRQELNGSIEEIAENNGMQEDIDVNQYINHMRQRRTVTPPTPTDDYDEMIDTSTATGDNKALYDTVKSLTGKQVVTKRIIDEAYTKLPEDVKRKHVNDTPTVALMSYALGVSAMHKKELDSPYEKLVKKLSGMDEISDEAIEKAYNSIPESNRSELPTDMKSALMFYASGETLLSVKTAEEQAKDVEKEKAQQEIESYYLAIPVGQKSWLPTDHAKAVEMFKHGEFLPFYETLPEEYKQVPEYVYLSLCKNGEQDRNTWMLYNRTYLMSQFCFELPYPLSVIPLSVLAECVPPAMRFGKSDLNVVKEMQDSLTVMFSPELEEPLVRVPIKALWLSLPPKERMHSNTKLKDIKLNLDAISKNFQVDNHVGDAYRLLLPNVLRDIPLAELAKRVKSSSNASNSPMFDIINNIDKLMLGEEYSPEYASGEGNMLMYLSLASRRYVLEQSLDIDDDDLSDEEYWDKYKGSMDRAFNSTLPSPLNKIPIIMFRYLLPDLGILNDSTKTEIAIINDYVSEHASEFVKMFPSDGECLWVPTCALNAWIVRDTDWSRDFIIADNVADELWRSWLPSDIRNTDYSDIDVIVSGSSASKNPDRDILMQTETLANILRNKD